MALRIPKNVETDKNMKKGAVANALNYLYGYKNGNFVNVIEGEEHKGAVDFINNEYPELGSAVVNLMFGYCNSGLLSKLEFASGLENSFIDMTIGYSKEDKLFKKNDFVKKYSLSDKGEVMSEKDLNKVSEAQVEKGE